MTLDQQIDLIKNLPISDLGPIIESLEELKQVKTITPEGGNTLTEEEAAISLREAMELIEHIGFESCEYQWKEAEAWMKKYFPAYASR